MYSPPTGVCTGPSAKSLYCDSLSSSPALRRARYTRPTEACDVHIKGTCHTSGHFRASDRTTPALFPPLTLAESYSCTTLTMPLGRAWTGSPLHDLRPYPVCPARHPPAPPPLPLPFSQSMLGHHGDHGERAESPSPTRTSHEAQPAPPPCPHLPAPASDRQLCTAFQRAASAKRVAHPPRQTSPPFQPLIITFGGRPAWDGRRLPHAAPCTSFASSSRIRPPASTTHPSVSHAYSTISLPRAKRRQTRREFEAGTEADEVTGVCVCARARACVCVCVCGGGVECTRRQ